MNGLFGGFIFLRIFNCRQKRKEKSVTSDVTLCVLSMRVEHGDFQVMHDDFQLFSILHCSMQIRSILFFNYCFTN